MGNARKMMGRLALSALALFVMGAFGVADAKEYVFGWQGDRSGPTQNIGPYTGDGCQDYIKLFNKENGLGKGNTLRVFEIDHGYNVPRGIESYERHKEAGALSIGLFGTPHTVALTPKLTEDKTLGTSPGFGSAEAANGEKYPYIFPIAASYWSQMAIAVKFVESKIGNLKGKKIAYLFYDNPAGREPLPILEDLSKQLGFKVQTYAVPPPGVEMRPQVLEIVRKYRADFVIAHIFGRGPSVSIKEFKRVRYPLNKVISFVWGAGESDMNAAGWDTAEGYYGIQFAGVGQDHKIIKKIIAMYGGKKPESMAISVFYNRGVFGCAVHAEAIRRAVQEKGEKVTPHDVKVAMESIKNFDLDGFLPPLSFSARDHEGGGWGKVYQVKGGKFVEASDWMQGYRKVVEKHVWGN